MCIQINTPSISFTFARLNELYSFHDSTVAELFKLPVMLTIDTRLRMFQLKIIHIILPTKGWLVRIKKIENAACYFCSYAHEDLEHLFVSCRVKEQFWLRLSRAFSELSFPSIMATKTILFDQACQSKTSFHHQFPAFVWKAIYLSV